MGSTAIQTFSNDRLMPYLNPEDAIKMAVNLAQGTYVKGQILGEVIATPGVYGAYSGTAIAAPTGAPTLAAGGSDGTIPAGTVAVGYTYTNGSAETTLSPTATQVLSANQHVAVTAVTPLPTGVTGVNWYMSMPGTDVMQLVASNVGAGFNILAPPAANAAQPPRTNSLTASLTGVQKAKCILLTACTVDSGGNISGIGEWGTTRKDAAVYIGGGAFFRTEDCTGLDATSLAQMGGFLVEGDFSSGIFRF